MSATALRSSPFPYRFMADDFSMLVRVRGWVYLRDGRAVRLH